MASMVVGGCGRAGRVAKANDQLRHTNIELQGQVQQLRGRVTELESELQVVRDTPEGAATLPEDVRANVPHVTAISIGRLSHAADRDADGSPDTLVLYVQPTDSLGRFVQMVGQVAVHAAILPADGDAITIGRAAFDAAQVRNAYRSAITGVHYTFDVLITLPQAGARKAAVHLEFTDGLTGRTFSSDRTIKLLR